MRNVSLCYRPVEQIGFLQDRNTLEVSFVVKQGVVGAGAEDAAAKDDPPVPEEQHYLRKPDSYTIASLPPPLPEDQRFLLSLFQTENVPHHAQRLLHSLRTNLKRLFGRSRLKQAWLRCSLRIANSSPPLK